MEELPQDEERSLHVLWLRVVGREGEAEAALLDLVREAHGVEDMTPGLPRRAGGTRGDEDASLLERVEQGLGRVPGEARVERRRDRPRGRVEDGPQVAKSALEALADDARLLRPLAEPLARELGGDAEAHDRREVLGPRAELPLLPAAMEQRENADSLADREGPGPERPVRLVPGDRVEVDRARGRRDLAERLRAVRVNEDPGPLRPGARRERVDREDRPRLVLDVHDRQQHGPIIDDGENALRIERAVLLEGRERDLEAVLLERPEGLEDARVLDGRGDDVIAAPLLRRRGPQQGEVVGLGRAAREDDLVLLAVDRARDLDPGVLEGARRLDSSPVETRRIAEPLAQEGEHGGDRLGGGARRRGGVEVDLLHHLESTAIEGSNVRGNGSLSDRRLPVLAANEELRTGERAERDAEDRGREDASLRRDAGQELRAAEEVELDRTGVRIEEEDLLDPEVLVEGELLAALVAGREDLEHDLGGLGAGLGPLLGTRYHDVGRAVARLSSSRAKESSLVRGDQTEPLRDRFDDRDELRPEALVPLRRRRDDVEDSLPHLVVAIVAFPPPQLLAPSVHDRNVPASRRFLKVQRNAEGPLEREGPPRNLTVLRVGGVRLRLTTRRGRRRRQRAVRVDDDRRPGDTESGLLLAAHRVVQSARLPSLRRPEDEVPRGELGLRPTRLEAERREALVVPTESRHEGGLHVGEELANRLGILGTHRGVQGLLGGPAVLPRLDEPLTLVQEVRHRHGLSPDGEGREGRGLEAGDQGIELELEAMRHRLRAHSIEVAHC